MISLLMLAAHMLGDYVLQTNYMAANKFTSHKVRALHVSLYTLCFIPVTLYAKVGYLNSFSFLGLVWLTHFITDCRRWASAEQWCAKPIMVDQTIHIVTLAILGVYFNF